MIITKKSADNRKIITSYRIELSIKKKSGNQIEIVLDTSYLSNHKHHPLTNTIKLKFLKKKIISMFAVGVLFRQGGLIE